MGNCGREIQTDINEILCDVRLWLIISILVIIKSASTKLIKKCKKALNKREETTTQQ